jgi:hypothetical protein
MPTCVKCGSLAWAVLLQWQNKHGQGQIKAMAVGTLMAHESCTLQPLFGTVLSGTCCTCNHHLKELRTAVVPASVQHLVACPCRSCASTPRSMMCALQS